ncbi:hypothetical protein [Methyloraptor flagellatus]|uniref:Lipoprotein n=1 Tax=Methyloraptor flagellatus TaxID=3162530 RepID=A0AAU7X5K7_9HYPH
MAFPMSTSPATARSAARIAAVTGLVLAGLSLAGCGSVSDGIGNALLRGTAEEPKGIDPAEIAKTPTCPIAEVRYGSEMLPLFEGGKQGDPTALRFQLTVQKVARDCDVVGDKVIARVGVAGRVLAGPKGATGTVSVPVRIAAVRGEQVLYSKVTTVAVPVNAPDYAANWSIIDDQVTIPVLGSGDVTIYAGLDGKDAKDLGPAKGKGKAKK